eukprot:1156043-Pelagomonas_calceolata.AAC.15
MKASDLQVKGARMKAACNECKQQAGQGSKGMESLWLEAGACVSYAESKRCRSLVTGRKGQTKAHP